MSVTDAEIAAGQAALKAYAESQSWEAEWVPDADYQTGAADVIKAADTAKDQTSAGRQAAGVAALRAALNSTGEGGEVSDVIVTGGTAAVLAAVAKLRAQEDIKGQI